MKKLISLLLVVIILGMCVVGCSSKDDETSTDITDSMVETTSDEYVPDIPKQDNGNRDFLILYPAWMLYSDYYFSDAINGNIVSDANYARQMNINEHLGIVINPVIGGTIDDVINKMKFAVLGGTNDYDLALTHCYSGVAAAAATDCFVDFASLKYVNLDAPYWRKDSMESIKIEDHFYLGSGSFILSDPCLILFNKDMVDSYPGLSKDELYQSVKDKTWTIDKLKVYATNVSTDGNATLTDKSAGTYGFQIGSDWQQCAFMASCDYFMVERDANGNYNLKNHNESIDNIFTAVKSLITSDYSYEHGGELQSIPMAWNTVMFAAEGLTDSINIIKNSSVSLGILPYPSLKEGQEIQCLDWAGYVVVPACSIDTTLSGAVAELLSYYGKKDIYPAFYDELLGYRAADTISDREMLDIIFDSLVYDPALTFVNNGANAMANIFYTIPRAGRDGTGGTSSWFAEYYRNAKNSLDFSRY